MQQCWDQYGVAFGGEVLQANEAIRLPGLVNGLVKQGLGHHFGPPSATVTFPTLRKPAVVGGQSNDLRTRIFALITGDPANASPLMVVQIDNLPPFSIDRDGSSDREFTAGGAAVTNGVHTISVWRTFKDQPSVMIPGSTRTSQYCIGPNCANSIPPRTR